MKNKALNLPYKLLIILSIFAILPACSISDDDDDASNSAPSVSAGEDQTVNQGATVDLVGVASDSDGSISSWLWQQTSGSPSVSIQNSTTSNAYFSAPTVDTETTLVFELEVKDNDGASVSDSMRVTVRGPGDSVNPLPNDFEAVAGDGQVTLTWSHYSSATDYNIYRSSASDCELANYTSCADGDLFTSKSSGFVDDDLTNGTTYYYWIEAILEGVTYLDGDFISATPRVDDDIDLTDGLVAHYEFENNADDSSGNGNDGEEFGGVSYTDGVIGQAANFYNSDEYIGIENDFALDDFSIAFYGRIDEVNSDYNFFFQARTSDKDNVLGFAYDHGFLHAQYSYSGLIGDSQYDYEYDLLASGWTHFVLQTSGDSNIDIYLNGSKVTSFDITKTDILLEYITLAQEQDCLRGCFESDQRLIGSLDDFRIYNRALNSEEIQALYELGQVNVNLSYGLLAHYEFEGDADDSSGNGNDGEEFGGVSYTDGVIGQAANFYNSDEYIGIENDFALDDFSIAFYGKIDEVNSDYNFFFQARTSDKDNVLGFAYDHGFLHAQYSYSGLIGDSQYDYEYDLLASGWTHFVLQTSGDSNIDIYLNGSKVTSFDITKTDILLEYITLAQEQDCLRGCFESDQRLIGSLDDFRIYNRALSAEEIQALYEIGDD